MPSQKPPMDAELRASLEAVSFPLLSHITPEIIQKMRTATATPPDFLDALKNQGISHREVLIPIHDSSTQGTGIKLSILQREPQYPKPRPCIYFMHGGGYHWGDKFHTLDFPISAILECDVVCVSVEYRLAPEVPFLVAVEDCFAGLKWTAEHATDLGIDPSRIMINGNSAGGGLAASVGLLCRDRGGPVVFAQCLICPMLDDRLSTVSSHQYVEETDFVPRMTLEDCWRSTLKDSQESILPPGRAQDLSGLPQTYLDVGSAEVFRDETVAYASRLWACGVQAELHVWAGGFHGFDMFLPEAAVSQTSRAARLSWARRVFACI